MNTFALATSLYGATDIEFAETMAWYAKMSKADEAEQPPITSKGDGLTANDMKFDIHYLMSSMEHTLDEVIYSDEIQSSAWWKKDPEFEKSPKEKFFEMDPINQQNALMETAMRIAEIAKDLEAKNTISTAEEDSIELFQVYCDWARTFEYNYCGTERYEDDFLALTDEWATAKLKEAYPVPSQYIRVATYMSDIIPEYNGDDNMAEIRVEKDVLSKYFMEEIKDDFKGDDKNVSDEGLFEEWLDEFTADQTIGLYSWLVNNGFGFEVTIPM